MSESLAVERVKCGVRSLRRELIFIRLIKYGSGASAACYETVRSGAERHHSVVCAVRLSAGQFR